MTSDTQMLIGNIRWIFAMVGFAHCAKSVYRSLRAHLAHNREATQKGLGIEPKAPGAA